MNFQVNKKEPGKTGAGRGDFLCGSRLLFGGGTDAVHLVGDDGEAAVVLTGTSSLDSGIEGEEVGLTVNTVDGLGTLLSSRGLLLYRLYNKE